MSIQVARLSICGLVICSLFQSVAVMAASEQKANTSGGGTASSATETAIAPGQCWIYGQIHPKQVEENITVTVKDSQTRIEITPAEIRRGYKRVVTREGTVTYSLQPPTYKQVEERVLVRPEVTRFVTEPAKYEEREKRIRIEDSRTVLEQCRTAGSGYTGAVAFCARETPAKEKVIKTQVLVEPEQTRVVVEPAQYKTVTKWVIDQPARVTKVAVDPLVAEVEVDEVAVPAQTRQHEEAAVTRTLRRTSYVGEPEIVMRRAVCDSDISKPLVLELQQRLQERGYDPGVLDGLLGQRTLSALSAYQADVGLAVGGITYESLEALGVTGIQ